VEVSEGASAIRARWRALVCEMPLTHPNERFRSSSLFLCLLLYVPSIVSLPVGSNVEELRPPPPPLVTSAPTAGSKVPATYVAVIVGVISTLARPS
jgi:hypothetical protein